MLLLVAAAGFAALGLASGWFLLAAAACVLLAGQALFTGLVAELLVHRTADTPYRVADAT